MYRKSGMKVELKIDRMGNLLLKPVSKYWQKTIAKYLASYDVQWDKEVLVQTNVDDTLEYPLELTKAQKDDLHNGWSIVILIDPWTFGQGFVGYDAGDRNYIPLD